MLNLNFVFINGNEVAEKPLLEVLTWFITPRLVYDPKLHTLLVVEGDNPEDDEPEGFETFLQQNETEEEIKDFATRNNIAYCTREEWLNELP